MSTARPRVRRFTDLLRLFVPPAIWFAQFTTLYLAEALMCAPPIMRPGVLIWIGIAATLVALSALMAFAFFMIRHTDPSAPVGVAFLHLAMWLTLLAGLAVIWTAFPVAVLPACAPPTG